MGDYQRAEPFASESLESTLSALKRTSVFQSERQQLAMNRMLRFRLDNYLSLAINEGERLRSRAAKQVLVWKGRTLVRQRAMRLAASDPAISDQFSQLQSVAGQLASLSRTRSNKDQHDRKSRIRELTAAKEKLESQLCLLYTSPSPRDQRGSRMPSSA